MPIHEDNTYSIQICFEKSNVLPYTFTEVRKIMMMIDFILSFFWLQFQVLNEANLKNAVLVRSVLTRSDLGGALIEGADFSDAVLDLPQKQVTAKYYSYCAAVYLLLLVLRPLLSGILILPLYYMS